MRYLHSDIETVERVEILRDLRLDTDLAETSIAGLQDFSDFLFRWNFLPSKVDVRAWIDPRPFDAALAQTRRAA